MTKEIESKDQRNMRLRKAEGSRERLTFLWTQWIRMRKYKMKTSGDLEVDQEVIKVCGPWLE